MTPDLLAHIYGLPVEELFTAAVGGGAMWIARLYNPNLVANRKR